MPCRACVICYNFRRYWLEKKERKKEQNCDLPSCQFATLVMVSGSVSRLFGQGNARKATVVLIGAEHSILGETSPYNFHLNRHFFSGFTAVFQCAFCVHVIMMQ